MSYTLETTCKYVTKKWKNILLGSNKNPAMCKKLVKILNKLNQKEQKDKKITPYADEMFTFARRDNYKVVILGQSPYSEAGHDHGLAFSSAESGDIPKNLARIYSCLVNTKVMVKRPKTQILTPWCSQGVLLMNISLTTEVGRDDAHEKMWGSYMDKVIHRLSKKSDKLIFLLWGALAQSKESLIDTKKHTIMKYCHPLDQVRPRFKCCDHFTQITKMIPSITWSLEPINTIWYTDGSCRNNQNRMMAKGAWGMHCSSGPNNIVGKSAKGMLPTTVEVEYEGSVITARPSNIRAEGTAIIQALKQLVKAGVWGNHLLYTDCKFWASAINDWIPGWLNRADFKWSSKKNSDLTKEMWEYYDLIHVSLGSIEINWVPAAHDYEEPEPNTEDWNHWNGNQKAHNLCQAAYATEEESKKDIKKENKKEFKTRKRRTVIN